MKWIDAIVKLECPGYCVNTDRYGDAPCLEGETKILNGSGELMGCRGLTCEQCWNQESEE